MERFRDWLLLLARSSLPPDLRGRIDPSDVVQQTMLAVVSKADGYRGATEAEAAAWLRRILANEIGMALRRIGRRPTVSIDAALAESSARLAAILDGDATPPGAAVERAEDAARLATALARLEPDQRTALELRHLDDLSVAEVARRMGRGVEAVAGLLYRGTKKLRTLLADPPEP